MKNNVEEIIAAMRIAIAADETLTKSERAKEAWRRRREKAAQV